MESQIEIWFKKFPVWASNLAVIVIALLVGLIIKLIVTAVLHHYKNTSDYSLFRSIITHLGKPLNYFFPLLTLNLILPVIALSKIYLDPLNKTVQIFLIISFAYMLVSSVRIFEDYIYFRFDLHKSDNLKERKVRTQVEFIRKITIVLVVLITLSIILLSFDNVRKIGAGLLTSVGIGGIIIGFAAQKSLANFLAGFQIAFTQPIRIDDVLVVEGEWGKVEDITLTYVVLQIWDQRRLILPINYFIEKPFQNWTRTSAELLGTVFLYMDYTIPIDALRQELDRLLGKTNLWDKRVGIIQVTDARENTIEVRVLVSAKDSSAAFDLRCYIRENMIKFIQENSAESLPKTRYYTLPVIEKQPAQAKKPGA